MREVIAASLLLWQVPNITDEGQIFLRRYKVTALPFVALIDPITKGVRQQDAR